MRLTQLTAGHQDAVLEFERANRDYFAGFITDRGDAFFAEYPARHAALLAMQAAGTDFFHLIVADDGATILGRVNLVDVKDGEAELGYRVGRDAAGRGVATEAVRQVCELAVGYGLRRLRAETSPDNHASREVLLRNGFTQDGDVFTRDLVSGEDTVFAVFDRQDSGCLSYGVLTATGERVFVKTSATPEAAESLKRAVRLHRKVSHPVLVGLTEAFMGEDGALTLIYPWCEGRLLYGHLDEFHRLPVAVRARAVTALLDCHLAIVAAGFAAVDLYDGCFLYDFERHEMRLIDIDEYRPGPFTVEADRMPGSRRFMAPEEFRRGAVIDERTTVFNLGRTIQILMGDPGLFPQATDPEPGRRLPTVAALVAAWHQAGLEGDDDQLHPVAQA